MQMHWTTFTHSMKDNLIMRPKTLNAQNNICSSVLVCRMPRPSTSKTGLCTWKRSLRLPTKPQTLQPLPQNPHVPCRHHPNLLPTPFLEPPSCQKRSHHKHSANQSCYCKNNSKTANKRSRNSKPPSPVSIPTPQTRSPNGRMRFSG